MSSKAKALVAVLLFGFPVIASAVNHPVSISGFAFNPAILTVNQGDTVIWTNDDPLLHTSISDQPLWDSGDLATSQSFSFRFDTTGTFTYHCARHPSMTGSITVNALPFDIQVEIHDNFYAPQVLQILPGQIVRWDNLGSRNHTVTSITGAFDSGTLTPGQFFLFTFSNEGIYHYNCLVHGPAMNGTVIVGKPDSVAFDIRIIDFAFAPAETALAIGQNARWINFGAMPHTSTDTTANHWDSGTLNPGDVFTLHADSAGLFHYICLFHPGSMSGTISVQDTAGGVCSYVLGDVNGSGVANGIDVGFLVNYFKGGSLPPISCDCPPHGVIFPGADVNGNCAVNGIDVSYLVNYFKGGPALIFCPACPPGE